MEENELILNAYIPSIQEYNKYLKKFRAFMSARLSSKAEVNETFKGGPDGTGWYFLRSACEGYFRYCYGISYGALARFKTLGAYAGLRVAFQLIYNPENSLVKGCQMKKQTSLVYVGNKKNEEVTSEAPIVEFGGKKCIWLNKKECESGKNKTMKLWTLELIDRAVPFDREGNHNDFGKATELQEQCESALTEGCSKEELDMLVPVKMSSKDGYEKVEPILEKKTEKKEEVTDKKPISLEEKVKQLESENVKLKAELEKRDKLIESVCKSLGYEAKPKEKTKAD